MNRIVLKGDLVYINKMVNLDKEKVFLSRDKGMGIVLEVTVERKYLDTKSVRVFFPSLNREMNIFKNRVLVIRREEGELGLCLQMCDGWGSFMRGCSIYGDEYVAVLRECGIEVVG